MTSPAATWEKPSRPPMRALRSTTAASDGWTWRDPKLRTVESGAAQRAPSALVAMALAWERKPSSAV